MSQQKRICIGEIQTAHGVRGLVKVRSYSGEAQILQKHGPLFTSETGSETRTLKLCHQAGGSWIAEVDGIADRNDAEKLRGTQLWIDRTLLPQPAENNYYHSDLIGLSVAGTDDRDWGKVVAVENFGAGDLLEIKPAGRPSFYIPFTDDYVPTVDLESGLITIDVPEGLVE